MGAAAQPTRPLDQAKVEKFVERMVEDIATATRGALTYIGDKLGIFRAMAAAGPVTVEELAKKTRLSSRYLKEWLGCMATAQYVEYNPETDRYFLPPEHAAPLANEDFPFFVGGFVQMIVPTVSVAPQVAKAFKTGGGVPQSAYSPEMFESIERGTAPRYKHQLTQKWIPAMPEVEAKLKAGGTALDVGCGSGRAAITLAKAFPKAHVFGFDNHPGSIQRARANAKAAGLSKRITFKAVDATKLPAGRFDFVSTFDVVHDSVNPVRLMANAKAAGLSRRITFKAVDATKLPAGRFDFVSTFDVVHDSVNPVRLMTSIRKALTPGGTYLMLEMNASPNVHENATPLGRLLYSVSTLYCMTTSLAHKGAGIGAVMGEPKARELAAQAGFTHFRKLPLDDPFSLLYELKA